MLKWMLAAGAAALAIASPSLAQKGHGEGGGNKGHTAHATKSGGGGGKVERSARNRGGEKVRVAHSSDERGGRSHNNVRMAQNEGGRGHGREHVKVEGHGGDHARVARFEGGQGRRGQNGQGENWNHQGENWNGHDGVRVIRTNGERIRVLDRDFDDVDARFAPRWSGNGLRRGFADGCPPGLAKKGNGCMPPGLAKNLVGTRIAPSIMSSSLVGPYRMWYPDNDNFIYRWDDDYIYRVRRDGGLIDAMFPFANRDYYYYPVGAAYPDNYNYYNVPYQYQSFYPDGGDYLYRYGDGAIYMVDPSTQMISGIAALLT